MLSLSPALPGPSHLTGHTQQIMALSPDSWPPSSNSDSDARSPAPDPPPIQPRFSPVAAALHPSTCCRSACPAAGLGLTLPPPSSQGVFIRAPVVRAARAPAAPQRTWRRSPGPSTPARPARAAFLAHLPGPAPRAVTRQAPSSAAPAQPARPPAATAPSPATGTAPPDPV